ncbi:hypothetical protein NC653_024807 [Populus alba x Populus x berolinensis]|uniref:Uncharacterized protein n=1 Tax=Populus alba x Populus x berolinensis TaxID=444605 RepID=A0AAD6M9P9_9ROSI|nr:hypothetical protein NC653_024807 [Populus alba x Populus x berolinensis]
MLPGGTGIPDDLTGRFLLRQLRRSLLRKWKHIPSSLRLSLFCLSAGCCNLEMLKWNCTINLFFFDSLC